MSDIRHELPDKVRFLRLYGGERHSEDMPVVATLFPSPKRTTTIIIKPDGSTTLMVGEEEREEHE